MSKNLGHGLGHGETSNTRDCSSLILPYMLYVTYTDFYISFYIYIHFYINNNFGALNELVSANFQMDSCLLMHSWSTAFFSELYDYFSDKHFWCRIVVWLHQVVKTFRPKVQFEHLVIKFWAKYSELQTGNEFSSPPGRPPVRWPDQRLGKEKVSPS